MTKHAARTEPLRSIWGRRLVSIPFYLGLATVLFAGAPLWFLLAVVVDLVAGGWDSLPRTRTLRFFAVYLACEVAGVAAATWLGVVTLGGRIGGPTAFVARNAALQAWWTGTLFRGALSAFSMTVKTAGLSLAERGPLLLFVRHASTADTVLAAAFIANPNGLLLRYVVKRELLWDPCLDIVGRRLPNAFVDRQAPRGEGEVLAVAALAEGLDARSAVLIYPEGTRFSAEKLSRARAALAARKLDALAAIADRFESVLPPRLGGPLALLDAAPGVDVVFLEHTGFEGAATFGTLWRGGLVRQTLHVRLRRFAATDIPAEGRDVWLFERWAEVDAWVRETRALEGTAP